MSGNAKPSGTMAQTDLHSAGALKIVLPARVDRFGRVREQTVVYAEVESMGTTAPDAGRAQASSKRRLSLSELAAGAPDLGSIGAGRPSTPVRASSRAAGDPVAQIKADVTNTLQPPPRFVSVPVIQGTSQPSKARNRIETETITSDDFVTGGRAGEQGKAEPHDTVVAPAFPLTAMEND